MKITGTILMLLSWIGLMLLAGHIYPSEWGDRIFLGLCLLSVFGIASGIILIIASIAIPKENQL
jgi:hypothetical protein